MKARDLFAGPGGWDLAARDLDYEVDGWELDRDTIATRDAARLETVGYDVRECDPAENWYDLEIASPPCETFGPSGLKAGRTSMPILIEAVRAHGQGLDPTWAQVAAKCEHPESALVLEPLRVLLHSNARAAVWEQAAAVLPIWEVCKQVLRARGWSVVTGVIRAEQYGIPQLRERAILMARRDGIAAQLPAVTHSRYYPRTPLWFDHYVPRWVSQGEALDLDGMIGFPRRADRPGQSVTLDGVEYRARDLRSTILPAQTITEKARSWSVWANGQERRPFTFEEAKIIQTFPADHPFQGSRSSQFLQCANAVPPALAKILLRELRS